MKVNEQLLELQQAEVFLTSKIEDIIKTNDQNQNVIYTLYKQDLIDEDRFIEFHKNKFKIKSYSLEEKQVDRDILNIISIDIMRTYFLLPLFKINHRLFLLMADPLDYGAISMVESLTKLTVVPVIGKYSSINYFLEDNFGVTTSIKTLIGSLEGKEITSVDFGNMENQIFQASSQKGPVTKLLHLILSQAISENASDIHFEPTTKSFQVRFRIDGVLHKTMSLPKSMISSIVTSIKILAKMDIAEKRVPLDGGFQVKVEDKLIDVRVSSFPTVEGEKIAIRLLDKEGLMFSLEDLGMNSSTLGSFTKMIRQNYGIILVTGPTGSGKTTTLYSALNSIKSIEKNIVTIEDPIEYHLDLINQSQVNVKAGLTFAKGLRSFLRQDPDIILLGEIRDKETAEIAFQAAMTGHLVFTTLHTNDAASAVTRLIDMGIPQYLIASSVIGVLSQRLIRKNCSKCAVSYKPETKVIQWVEEKIRESSFLKQKATEAQQITKSEGCEFCKESGYRGRVGVFELMEFDEDIRTLVHQSDITTDELNLVARQKGMISFIEDAISKAMNGVTTFEEIMRVLR